MAHVKVNSQMKHSAVMQSDGTEIRRRYRVAWLLAGLSPLHQAMLEATASHPDIDLQVFLGTRKRIPGRVWEWKEKPGSYGLKLLRGFKVGPFCFNPGIVAVCVKQKYDLFIISSYEQPTCQAAMATLTLLGRRWAFASERPGLNPKSCVRNLLRRIALWLPKMYADCAIGTGHLAAQAFKDMFDDERRSYSIPYLLDLEPFLSIPLQEPHTQDVNFLFCGQLIERKGIDILCEAAGRVFESGSSARLSVVGDGPERYRIDELKARFPARVQFHGFVPFAQRVGAYADANVLVFPSRHDGWGAVVHEAMARGMPVISSATVGAAYDLIEHGVNGFMVEPNDPDGYRRAMQFFVEKPAEIARFGLYARAKARQFSPAWGAEELVKILEAGQVGRSSV